MLTSKARDQRIEIALVVRVTGVLRTCAGDAVGQNGEIVHLSTCTNNKRFSVFQCLFGAYLGQLRLVKHFVFSVILRSPGRDL